MNQIVYRAEKFQNHIPDIGPIRHKYRKQRSQMQQNGKRQIFLSRRLNIQKILGNGQMPGAGYRQKFRNSLNQS